MIPANKNKNVKRTISIGQTVKLKRERIGKIVDKYFDAQNNLIDYTLILDNGSIIGTNNTDYIKFKDNDKSNDKKGGEIIYVKPQQGIIIDKTKRKYLVKLSDNSEIKVYRTQLLF